LRCRSGFPRVELKPGRGTNGSTASRIRRTFVWTRHISQVSIGAKSEREESMLAKLAAYIQTKFLRR